MNGAKSTPNVLKVQPWYSDIKKKLGLDKDKEVIPLIVEYAQMFPFDKDNKQIEKEDKQREKDKKLQEKEDYRRQKELEVKERLNENNMNDWEKNMIRDEKGYIDKFQKRNMYLFFKEHPAFKNKFKFNDFSKLETYDNDIIEPHIITRLSFITEQYIGNNNDTWVAAVSNVLCHENTYNPIINALNKLPEWDGKERVETYLIDYIGALNNHLNRSITKKWFYALFERLFHPGCRFDHMLITYDETHGTGKSTIMVTLLDALQQFAGNTEEDNGSIPLNDLGFDKDTVQCLNKAWIAWVDELAKFLKEEPEDVKKFITLTTDNARLSYAKLNKNFPRHCVFYGSTNTKEFIKDTTDTYERRFWVIDCEGTRHENGEWWKEKLPDDIKLQVLAEAYKFWKDNPLYSYNELDDEDIEALREVQRYHTTASKDIVLGNKLMTILDFEYSNPEGYITYYEWKKEAKSLWESYTSGVRLQDNMSITTTEIEFFGEKIEENELKNVQKTSKNEQKMIQKLPVIWVKQYVQEELGRMINDDNYINKLIDFKWIKNKNAVYNGHRNCFCRIA